MKTCALGVSASSRHRQPGATPKNGKIVKSYSGVEVYIDPQHKTPQSGSISYKKAKISKGMSMVYQALGSALKDGSPR